MMLYYMFYPLCLNIGISANVIMILIVALYEKFISYVNPSGRFKVQGCYSGIRAREG